MRRLRLPLLLLALALGAEPGAAAEIDYVEDVRVACARIGEECKVLLAAKDIPWPKITRDFVRQAKAVASPGQHLALLWRLLARLQDGHAAVLATKAGESVRLPAEWSAERKGPGLFWCRVGKKLYVKNSWAGAQRVGIEAGMEIVKVDGLPASKWLAARIASLRDRIGFSTEQHAEQFACHWGLAEPVGTRIDLQLKDRSGKQRKRTVVCDRAGFVPDGPAFAPADLQGTRDVRYGRTPKGFGYIHYRRCKGSVTHRTDDALKALGNVPGLILDFRANGGGGFDHEGLMGRFVPAGRTLAFQKRYGSEGSTPYGGPIVVLVDGLTRSAGETGSGMFKEDGRAYMIGESPTAGMSSSKKTLELPSGLFQLYVSVASNMRRFNDGEGVEGIGVVPHEILPYDPDDLAAGRDTLIARAEVLLTRWPKAKVLYDPKRFGWAPP